MRNLFDQNYRLATEKIIESLFGAFVIGVILAASYERYYFESNMDFFNALNIKTFLRIIEGGVEGIIYLTAIEILLAQWIQWRATIKLIGLPSFYILNQNYLFSKKSKKYIKFKHSILKIVGGIILFAILYFIAGFRAIIVCCVAVMVYSNLAYFCFALPPTILFLGVSNERTIALQAMIRDQLGQRHRVVSLLDVENYYHPFTGPRSVIGHDCLRTKGDNWEEVFHFFAERVPIIIIDGRGFTDAVKKELHHIFSKSYEYKTILITEINGKTKFEINEIFYKKYLEKTSIAKMPERTMFALILELTRSTGNLPKPNYGANEILKKYSNCVIV